MTAGRVAWLLFAMVVGVGAGELVGVLAGGGLASGLGPSLAGACVGAFIVSPLINWRLARRRRRRAAAARRERIRLALRGLRDADFELRGITFGHGFLSVFGRHCRVCGCTDADCSGCVERTGAPCSWVAPDLCSACVGLVAGDLVAGDG